MQSTPWQQQQQVAAAATQQQVRIHTQHACLLGGNGLPWRCGVQPVTTGQLSKHMLLCFLCGPDTLLAGHCWCVHTGAFNGSGLGSGQTGGLNRPSGLLVANNVPAGGSSGSMVSPAEG